MQRDREKKSWREIDRAREGSVHRRDTRDRDRQREQTARENAATKQYRKALEALFSPKKPDEEPAALPKTAARIVLPPNPEADPRNEERRKLLGRVLAASGPASISKAANEFIEAGFDFPEDQEVYLQLLEHTSEDRVRDAIDRLAMILAGQVPKRKPVLEQRLRRIEEHAEEASTRDAAASLRRLVHGRPQASAGGGK